jgi:hypothetical protein
MTNMREYWAREAEKMRDKSGVLGTRYSVLGLDPLETDKSPKPKVVESFFVSFKPSSDYRGAYGFDAWTKEKEALLTHVTYDDRQMPKQDYYKKANQKVPPPYNKYVQGACFLCLQLGITAQLEMQVEATGLKPNFEIGDMFYIATNLDLSNMEVKLDNKILKTTELTVNGSSSYHSLYPIEAINAKKIISITLQDNGLEYRKKPFLTKETPLTVYFKKVNSPVFTEVGKIVFFPNKTIIVPVKVVTFSRGGGSDDALNLYKFNEDTFGASAKAKANILKVFQQSCVQLQFEKTKHLVIDDSFNPYIETGLLKDFNIQSTSVDEFGNEVDANGKIIHHKDFMDKFLSFYERDKPLFHGIVLLATYMNEKKEPKTGGRGIGNPLNAKHAILHARAMVQSRATDFTIYHEMGHIFGLLHTFYEKTNLSDLIKKIEADSAKQSKEKNDIDKIREMSSKSPEEIERLRFYDTESRFLILKKTALGLELNRLLLFKEAETINVMDYGESIPYRTFYFWQWQIIRDEAEKFYSIQ